MTLRNANTAERDMSEQDIRTRAIRLYKPPFKYECGYITDAYGHIVVDRAAENAILRLRGWGRIGYLPDPEKLQDEVGILVAEILTTHWPKP